MDNKRNRVIAVLFVLLITVTGAGIGVKSIVGDHATGAENEALQTGGNDGTAAKNEIAALSERFDGEVNQSVPGRYTWINLNGLFQRLIGRRMVEDSETDVYKMKNGQLIYGADTMEDAIVGLADSVADFSRELSASGVPLLYVQLPYKIENGEAEMPAGTTEYANSNATGLVMELDERQVKTLDLRDESVEAIDFARQMDNRTDKWADLFYNTDQHWTNQMALWAAGRIASEVTGGTSAADNGVKKKVPGNLMADRFRCKVLKNKFLGSFGKKTGAWYGGMDDYSIVVPDYDTEFEFTIKARGGDKVRSGDFAEAFLDESNLDGNPFEVNTYETYTGGNYAYTTAVNKKNSKGPKVLLIRDSFSCAMMPFLALECSELTAIDLRYLKSISALEMARSGDYDAVVIAYNPSMFGTETFSFK